MTERMNMLRIDAPQERGEQYPAFDAKREIPKQAWDYKETQVHGRSTEGNWDMFCRDVSHLALIDRDKVPKISPDQWQKIEKGLEEIRTKQSLDQFLKQAVAIAVVDPARTPVLSEAEWGRCLKFFEERKAAADWALALDLAWHMKILDPSRAPRLTENDVATVLASVGRERTERNKWLLSRLLVGLKMLGSATRVSDDEWDALYSLKKEEGIEAWDNLWEWAIRMKIIAADEVRCTGRGIEFLTHRNSDGKTLPPIPEISAV